MTDILSEEYGQFTCPRCGSHFFGTTSTLTMKRQCKGHYTEFSYTGCEFTFPDEDAHLYGMKQPEFPPTLHIVDGIGEIRKGKA